MYLCKRKMKRMRRFSSAARRGKPTFINRLMAMVAVLAIVACSGNDATEVNAQTTTKMYITIDGQTQGVTLADTQAAQELAARLQDGPITVTLNDNGGFEIWGSLGFSLTSSNQQITAQPGDVILYSGSNICIFYGSNSWSYTRLGKIDGLSADELRTFLKGGQSNIAVTLSLSSEAAAIHQVHTQRASDGHAYKLNGQLAHAHDQGIIIKDGKKIVK